MKAKTIIVALIPPAVILSIAGYFLFASATEDNPEKPVTIDQEIEKPSDESTPKAPEETPAATVNASPEAKDTREPAQQAKPDETTAGTEEKKDIVVPPANPEAKEPKSDYYYKILTSNAEALSSNDLWRKFANQPDCLVTLVKIVEQLSNGSLPLAAADFDFLPVPSPFSAVQNGYGDYVASSETMNRFTAVVEAIRSVSTPNVKDLLNYLEPELNRIVHEKLGYPQEMTFRTMLKEALNHVLATPLLSEPPPLIRLTSRIYRYKDEKLEQLSQAQKFILRLGPVNQKALFEYLTKILHNV